MKFMTLSSILDLEIGIEDSGLQCCPPVRMGVMGLSQLQQLFPIVVTNQQFITQTKQ
jgi:hypothetical protein